MINHSFLNDYSEGAHPSILELLTKTNLSQETGYGEDRFSIEAAGLIKTAIQSPDSDVHFVSAGTQANFIVLSAMLKSYESVMAPVSGHTNVHEAGALEATGHKINPVETPDGKLNPLQIKKILEAHQSDQMVKPKVVYVSNSTELGTIYKKKELEDLSRCCRENDLYLYLDGARLGMGLCSSESDLTLPDVARLTDAFYIGGTKNGALLGEAVVIKNPSLKPHFRRHLKQRGALLAKGRLLGLQFVGLFSNGLYFELAKHANAMASKLAKAIEGMGFEFLTPPVTNQIFPILPDLMIEELRKKYAFYTWSPSKHGYSAIRLVTSWATPQGKVEELVQDIQKLAQAAT